MKSIAVYCGSSAGTHPIYREAARLVGHLLAEHGIRLVFGGGKVGLMGAVADAALEKGGEVLGVIPTFLDKKEVTHRDCTELKIVHSMHERKLFMYDASDGFLALPGGFGTMDELFESLTWGQLGLHPKPIGLLNVHNFFDPLMEQIDRMLEEGFLNPTFHSMVLHDNNPEQLLNAMGTYIAPDRNAWLKHETT